MRSSLTTGRLPVPALSLDVWLWAGSLTGALAAGIAHYGNAGPVTQFFTALVAVGFTATTMGRAIDQVSGRLSPGGIGIFQAVTGNLPELVIGGFALSHGLYPATLATIAGSALNLLLFCNGLAFLLGGLRHGSMNIDTDRAQNTCVMLVLMVATLVMPAVAVQLRIPAGHHATVVSYIVAAALLTVFLVALPGFLRRDDDDDQDDEDDSAGPGKDGGGLKTRPLPAPAARLPLRQALVLLAISGLLIAEEADWLTTPMGSALDHLHINQVFAGLFILATVSNLSQLGPAIQLVLRGDADTATQINVQGALQVVLMVGPILMFISPLIGAGGFALVFPPFTVIALIATALLVVFVILDGEVNYLEGTMLLALYAVLGSLFWWS